MFSLPAPAEATAPSPALILDEASTLILTALQMIYGFAFPHDLFNRIEEVEELLRFCDKYGMPGPMCIARSSILRPTLLNGEELRVYKLGCRYDWPDVAQLAAMKCLTHDLTAPETIVVLSTLPATDYGALLLLARRRRDEFRRRLDDPTVFIGSSPNHACHKCNVPSNDWTWKVLRMKMIEEFERCPSGDTIRAEGIRDWLEWKQCMAVYHCEGSRLFHADGTKAKIVLALEGLPESLQLQTAENQEAAV